MNRSIINLYNAKTIFTFIIRFAFLKNESVYKLYLNAEFTREGEEVVSPSFS